MHRLLCLLLLLPFAASAQAPNPYYFDYNTNCAEAYRAYMALRIEDGDALIRKEILSRPYNLCATYIADYGDCLLLLFNGDPNELKQRAGGAPGTLVQSQ